MLQAQLPRFFSTPTQPKTLQHSTSQLTMADSQHTYSPIDLSTNAIRVLRLCYGYVTDPIVCELVQIFLEDDGVPYEALSYTWGDASAEVEITLDGQAKKIKDNLYTALCCLRQATEDRWLWVDALCIDQADHREKTHQVGRMRQIYEKADQVLIWLGAATEDTDQLIEMGNTFAKRARRRTTYRRNMLDAWLEEWPVYMKELPNEDNNIRRRNGLLDMLRRHWFQRVWVVQEAFTARRAVVLCGWSQLSSETFVLLPMLMQVEVDESVQSILDVMPGYLRHTSWRSHETKLRVLLAKFKYSEAKDPRDKIYALLGIASDVRSDGKLQADYTVSEQMAVHRTMSYLLFGESPTMPICILPPWDFDILVHCLDKFPQRVLEWAISDAEEDAVREILARTEVDMDFLTSSGTPMLCAAAHRFSPQPSAQIMRRILNHKGANVNIQNGDRDTPLHIAAEWGHEQLVSVLLEREDVELNTCNKYGLTPLELALVRKHMGVVSQLAQHNSIDLSYVIRKDILPRSETGLLFVVIKHHIHLLELLLGRGTNLDAFNFDYNDSHYGETALYTAAGNNNLPLAELLLRYGADPEIGNTYGKKPIWIASERGHHDIVQLLIDNHAERTVASKTKFLQVIQFFTSFFSGP